MASTAPAERRPVLVSHSRAGLGFLGALLLALAIVGAAWIGAHAFIKVRGEQTVTVRGATKMEITADRIVWRSDVSATAPTLVEASTALGRNVSAMQKFLADHDVKGGGDTKVTVESINTQKLFAKDNNNNDTTTVVGYTLNQQVVVESDNVDKIELVSKGATSLLGQGIEVVSSSPDYIYTKGADLRIKLLEQAAQDGKRRAQTVADNAGGKLGNLQHASMGVFQILPRYSVDVEDYGSSDTSSKLKDASVTVSLTYELE